MKNIAIITAGGVGKRMGKGTYKQFLRIYDIPILALTIQKFQYHPKIDGIILVVPEDTIDTTRIDIVEKFKLTKVIDVISGGKERQYSVKNAINIIPGETEHILVHDGVRPFITKELISNLLSRVKKEGAVIPAVRPKETIKNIDHNQIIGTIDRSEHVLVQTPQVFRKNVLVEAYNQKKFDMLTTTDDSSLVEMTGHKVMWIPGLEQNIKITTPSDLAMAEFIYKYFEKGI